MKVDVPKGKGTITLSFIPNGFVIGAACSLTALLLLGSIITDEIYLRQKKIDQFLGQSF